MRKPHAAPDLSGEPGAVWPETACEGGAGGSLPMTKPPPPNASFPMDRRVPSDADMLSTGTASPKADNDHPAKSGTVGSTDTRCSSPYDQSGNSSPNASVSASSSAQGGVTSYDIFMHFVSWADAACDASGILSRACFETWLKTRKGLPALPEDSYRRIITAHLTGTKKRRPFPPPVEAHILALLRQRNVWPCFAGYRSLQEDQGDKPLLIGKTGFRAKGYHEQQKRRAKPFLNKPPKALPPGFAVTDPSPPTYPGATAASERDAFDYQYPNAATIQNAAGLAAHDALSSPPHLDASEAQTLDVRPLNEVHVASQIGEDDDDDSVQEDIRTFAGAQTLNVRPLSEIHAASKTGGDDEVDNLRTLNTSVEFVFETSDSPFPVHNAVPSAQTEGPESHSMSRVHSHDSDLYNFFFDMEAANAAADAQNFTAAKRRLSSTNLAAAAAAGSQVVVHKQAVDAKNRRYAGDLVSVATAARGTDAVEALIRRAFDGPEHSDFVKYVRQAWEAEPEMLEYLLNVFEVTPSDFVGSDETSQALTSVERRYFPLEFSVSSRTLRASVVRIICHTLLPNGLREMVNLDMNRELITKTLSWRRRMAMEIDLIADDPRFDLGFRFPQYRSDESFDRSRLVGQAAFDAVTGQYFTADREAAQILRGDVVGKCNFHLAPSPYFYWTGFREIAPLIVMYQRVFMQSFSIRLDGSPFICRTLWKYRNGKIYSVFQDVSHLYPDMIHMPMHISM